MLTTCDNYRVKNSLDHINQPFLQCFPPLRSTQTLHVFLATNLSTIYQFTLQRYHRSSIQHQNHDNSLALTPARSLAPAFSRLTHVYLILR